MVPQKWESKGDKSSGTRVQFSLSNFVTPNPFPNPFPFLPWKSINTYSRVPYIGLKKPLSAASSSFLFLLSLLSSSSILQTYSEVPLGPHLQLSFLEKFRGKRKKPWLDLVIFPLSLPPLNFSVVTVAKSFLVTPTANSVTTVVKPVFSPSIAPFPSPVSLYSMCVYIYI